MINKRCTCLHYECHLKGSLVYIQANGVKVIHHSLLIHNHVWLCVVNVSLTAVCVVRTTCIWYVPEQYTSFYGNSESGLFLHNKMTNLHKMMTLFYCYC